MKVLTDIPGLRDLPGPLHLAIGVFDGVHLGHRSVIEAARESAVREGGSAAVVTFVPHPVEVLAPEHSPRLLTNAPHKLAVLEREAGIAIVLLVSFDRDFAAHTGEAFIERLLDAAPPEGIARICVGEEWRFGRGRSGDVALLERIGKERGFSVSGLGLVEIDGQRVSSTRVREAVALGDLETASRLLGRRYSVYGAVVKGRQLGRTIGFPTANLAISREQLPPAGVYAVSATGADRFWNGVANLGVRPTVEGEAGELRLEVHLFGLEHEIYGEELEVTFVRKMRDERKFDSLPALQAQIAEDVAAAQRAFAGSAT